jgi:putative endonuclease
MHYVYVLYSLKDQRLYKGSTSDISKRLLRHNRGSNRSTAHKRPFVLVHVEAFADRSTALSRESFLKTLEGGSKLKVFLHGQGILDTDGRLALVGE